MTTPEQVLDLWKWAKEQDFSFAARNVGERNPRFRQVMTLCRERASYEVLEYGLVQNQKATAEWQRVLDIMEEFASKREKS